MRNSDLIVPHGVQNDIAIQFIVENLKNKLLSRGVHTSIKNMHRKDIQNKDNESS